jgi:hypothetical protein
MNSCSNLCTAILFSVFLLFDHGRLFSQNTSYTQFWNEIDLVRAFSDKWAAEIDLAGTYSSTPSESAVLKTIIQRSAVGWVHYFLSARWKFSSYLGYYYNKDVPDIGQYEAPEWRYAIQATYFFHKVTYALSTDMRAEVRFLKNEEGVFEDIYRYHQKLKFRLPLNSRVFRQGVVYILASDEIIFRSVSKETGLHYFDLNLFTIGGGYLFTDDLQLELVYINMFIPRDKGNEIDHVVSLTFTANNLISHIGKLFKSNPAENIPDE